MAAASSSDRIDRTTNVRTSTYSFVAANYIYERLRTKLGPRKVIIDVGTGRLQRASVMDLHNTHYIFVDPELNIHGNKALHRQLVTEMHNDAASGQLAEP